ncbi:MAG: hypothetical protein E7057_09495 [Lentisphaerae bacterium]|nr:hypothetical protein [Lentisphaerota bacterium]
MEEVSLGFFFRKKESLAKKMNCRAAPLSRLDRFIFCTAVCGKPGFCKEQAKEHTMYVTARATQVIAGSTCVCNMLVSGKQG